MADVEGHGASAEATIENTAIDSRLVKAGVDPVTFFRASPLRVTNPMLARMLVKAAHVGQGDDGFVAAANAGNGKIIAIAIPVVELGQLWSGSLRRQCDAATVGPDQCPRAATALRRLQKAVVAGADASTTRARSGSVKSAASVPPLRDAESGNALSGQMVASKCSSLGRGASGLNSSNDGGSA
jgi:hypothetical protein